MKKFLLLTIFISLVLVGQIWGEMLRIGGGQKQGISFLFFSASGVETYSVTYSGNDSTSGTVPTDDNEYEEGDTVIVLDNTGTLAKTDYVWSGWNTAADGSGTDYAADATFEIGDNDVVLYVRWVSLKPEIELTVPAAPTITMTGATVISETPVSDNIELTVPDVPTVSVSTLVE